MTQAGYVAMLAIALMVVGQFGCSTGLQAQRRGEAAAWDTASYPDESGFRRRSSQTLGILAETPYGQRSLASSQCPDTGLAVRVWALEGEEIISPYTGRRYIQGPTGYFGPKARGDDGRITAFGGDPLKYDLPPATAVLLRDPNDPLARAFLSIPGNLNQQYHFAAANWARFYGLLGEAMPPGWHEEFAAAIGAYREERRPSDGEGEWDQQRPFVHDLVGEEGEFFGGNVVDGGTENHKTMWRTSGLLYAQLLPEGSRVSGYPLDEARRIISLVLHRGWRDILTVGNGEWDSSIYYPHSIRGFLNLYDFSPDETTRAMAQAALDFYFATYGLKMLDGTFVGPQKRGFVSGMGIDEMDRMTWAFVPRTRREVPSPVELPIQQATTRYRPNRVIANLIAKDVPLPFEAQIARPTYHLRDANAFQETFYCDESFALGSIAMTMQDNPTQQTVWSLGARTPQGTIVFGGGQPRHRSPEGHSPWTQVVQKRGAMVLLTAGEELRPLPEGISPEQRWQDAPQAAESWLFVPRGTPVALQRPDLVLIEAGEVWLVVRPIGDGALWMRADEQTTDDGRGSLGRTLLRYDILVVQGRRSGYVIEAAPRRDYPQPDDVLAAIDQAPPMTVAAEGPFEVNYASLLGDRIVARHEPAGLRASGQINGEPIDWANWAGGGVYQSPYLRIRDGQMYISDGREAYVLDYSNLTPTWRQAEP